MKEAKLIAEAERLVAAGQLDQALRTYKKVLKTKPGHGRVHLACARIALDQGDRNLAHRHLKIAQRAMADRHEYLELLGDFHRSKSEWSAAENAYEACQKAGGDRRTVLSKLAALARAQGQIQTALNHYQAALSIDSDFALAQIGIGEVLDSIGQPGHALRWYSRASTTDQGAVLATQKMRKLVDAAIQRWHFPMMNDTPRNNAFSHAITKTLTGGEIVLDIGTGSGLLALMAARAGASHVYACDDNGRIAHAARQVISANGASQTITVLEKRSTQLKLGGDMPARATALICEIFDAGFFGEDALATIQHAKQNLLTADAKMVPDGVRIWVIPVSSEALSQYYRVDEAAGFDVSNFNALSDPRLLQIDLARFDHTPLSQAKVAFEIDFRSEFSLSGQTKIVTKATDSGPCHGFVYWYELLANGEPFLSTSPGQASTHWRQAFMPALEGVHTFERGQTYSIRSEYQRFLAWFEIERTTTS